MSPFARIGFVVLALVGAAGCAPVEADVPEGADADGEEVLRRTRDTANWSYQGPMPTLDSPRVVVSLAGHTVRVTGLLPTSFTGTLPYHAITEPDPAGTGRTQARSIGAEWKRLGIPVGQVLASPYCRTRDVAQLMFGRYERSNDVRGGPVEDGADRYAGLKRLLSTLPQPPSTNLVISSHGNPYQAVIGAPYLAEGEASVIRPLGEGRWEVLARLKADDWARLK